MKSDLKTLSELEVPNQVFNNVHKTRRRRRKNKNQNKCDLGVDFIAPDGGWGWIVVIAAAISILVTFAVFHPKQFETIFKHKFEITGISSSQMTTILYVQEAAATCTAFLNGELFRRFTFRQISFVGAIFTFFGLALTLFANSFYFHLLTLSIMCGIGRSLIYSSTFIVVCTYFKENLRSAISCMCLIAGMGPICLPYLTTFLIDEYGTAGRVLFFAGLSLHNFACSLAYQPVKWHNKKHKDIELTEIRPLNLVFGSLHIEKLNALENSTNSNSDLNNLHRFSKTSAYPLRVPKNSVASFEPLTRPIPKIILPDETEYLESPQEVDDSPAKVTNKKPSILEKISLRLELDLLKDISFINLALGLTLIHLVEINYELLTPFLLNDFGFNENQTQKAMSLLAICDLLMRMSIPIVARNLRCSNKAVLLYALTGLCVGRTFLAFNRNFTMVVMSFGWIGLCTGVRSVFWMLILPSYIPLSRLPAAIGLQQVAMGLCMLTFGRFGGLVENAVNYRLILLCMNAVYLLIAFIWLRKVFLNTFTLLRK